MNAILESTGMFDTIKVVDINPAVPEDQIHDLLCEKFSSFSNFTINIVQKDRDLAAYLCFKSCEDAYAALKENSYIALFGYTCRTVPVYNSPRRRGPLLSDPASDDYNRDNADEYDSDSVRKSRNGRESVSPDGPSSGPRGRGFRYNATWSTRRGRAGRWQRGRNTFTARGRGRPYILTASRGGRGGRGRADVRPKPYLLTKPSDDDEQKQKPRLSPQSWTELDSTEGQEPNSTLYVGSMDSLVQVQDLKRLFNSFGFVLDVEIKHPSSSLCFAFVHFLTMDMATLAMQEMQGKAIGRVVPKLGYGRNNASKCLWVGGLGSWTSVDMLKLEFGQFGEIEKVEWPKNRDYAFVVFISVQDAIEAKQLMHGNVHGDPPHRLRICFATDAQLNSHIHYKEEFPKFPRIMRPDSHPKKNILPYSQKNLPRDRKSQESRRRRRRSPERNRSRSRSRPRKTHSHIRSKRKERSPSPYARSISRTSSENDMSAISATSSEGSGSAGRRKRQRKRHRKSSVSRSPANKLLRNPSPPKSATKDERTVVLRSESQSAAAPTGTTSAAFTSVVSHLHAASVPTYIPAVDPVAYYPALAGTLPPTMLPPPVHMPPPDFYMPPNPMMMRFPPQHLTPLTSYPPVVSVDSTPPAAVQSGAYLPSSSIDKSQPDAAPKKEIQKPVGVSVATKFPKVWSGALVLRNAAFVVDFHLVSGSVLLVNSLLGGNVEPGSEGDCPVLKIAQRLRLDQPEKLNDLSGRLKKAGRATCSVLLATSTPAQVDDDANVVQQYPLSSLVSYLLQKQVAAVVSLPPGSTDARKTVGVLHAFPPCQFATEFLNREAPGLPTNCPTEEELLVILCEGNI